MSVSRLLPSVRRTLTTSARNYSSAAPDEGKVASSKLWQNLTFFVALPSVAICMVNAYLKEKEHIEHFHRPEFVPYEHMRIRNKKFPWGDGNHTLFHNPKVNALPDGYEEIEGEEEEGGSHH